MCTVEGCDRGVYARGVCVAHYRRLRKGKPLDAPWTRGGRPAFPWTAKALEILADGEWHDYNRLVVAMTRLIPPNAASAHMQLLSSSALNQRARREAEGKTRETRRRLHTSEQVLRSARRDMAWRRLYDLWKQGRIEIDPPPVRGRGAHHYTAITDRRVRLTPVIQDRPRARTVRLSGGPLDGQRLGVGPGVQRIARFGDHAWDDGYVYRPSDENPAVWNYEQEET